MGNPFDFILNKAPIFLLVAVRIFGMIMTTPLLSTRAFSRVVKVALAGLLAFLIFPLAVYPESIQTEIGSHYILLLIGEGLLGVLTGFFINMIFVSFSTAGQFFSYQMGFGASEVYDALAQIENPLMGQFLNFIAVLTFLQVKGFQTLFLGGVLRNFQTINCFIFLEKQAILIPFFMQILGKLFLTAMIIAAPIMGTLFLIHVSMGLLTKATPQMNLLSEGFPITIMVTFFLLSVALPYMINLFIVILQQGFETFEQLLIQMGTKI
ncbi:flagellar biosynthetic protein FliR [Treponema phagedenis]|uniref:Flagellar biosynthetic protein FliR n=1 Tax=Treponema phagedenis TaxID=162 RepID=A0A0B7GXU0_TREPH|nr:flagellar biosynthetic protein FliR [Treponema phagedenis]NVP24125.1 flagellar biosynthetic protein FliR [Treponema phagedenis]QEJ96265.1 flagellar biosynthetic protein FliR [Treponema phagedenis]QEJ99312.1 flagellar biosynthetic protein FliR [Treponema phagedenis]QEK00043.1 flagellar biosynthetic protein FliR [Treponema phagedenis]QEK04883.1 flagellar biosynthetic protein FliR [Treponema phagedenis]